VLATLVAALLACAPAQASFPGANGKIAFPDGNHLYAVDPTGTNQITLSGTPGAKGDPAWSPNGSKVLFTGAPTAATALYVANADGTQETLVYDGTSGSPSDPTWSPDGSRIAWVVLNGCDDFHCESSLWTANPDGTQFSIIRSGTGEIIEGPAWSPDGSRIAFGAGVGFSAGRIYTVKPDGSGFAQLFDVGGVTQPSWSPDGSQLAVVSRSKIAKVNVDGSGFMDLSGPLPAGTTDLEPAWSPDGQSISFVRSAGSETRSVYTMNTDGSGKSSIATFTSSYERKGIDWQPLNALDRYPRPGGGSPYRVPLVPAFRVCGGSRQPNSAHISPLAFPSCAPPLLDSDQLTLGTVGGGQGSARLVVIPGDRTTAADEADVQVSASMSDVRMRPSGSDYAGSLILTTALRITDRANGFGDVAATVSDAEFSVPFPCTTTPSIGGFGSDCSLVTTADTLVPGVIKEGKRTIWSIRELRVRDAGADGNVGSPPSCPPTCGTGDERTFLDQGLYTP
jgi:hypothetical protein